MNDRTNYLKLGRKAYALTPIEADVDIEEELQQYYNNALEKSRRELNEGVVRGLKDEWDTQIEHIRDVRARHSVTVPESLHGRIMYCDGRRVYETRCVHYSPRSIVGYRDDYCNKLRVDESELIESMPDSEALYEAQVDCDFRIPLIFYYDDINLRCLNDLTPHCYSDGRVCTGSNRAVDFWNHPDFEKLVCAINFTSVNRSYIKYKGATLPLSEIIKLSNLSEIRERGATWTV